ncbi:biotin carboxylase [Streptomyces sp. NPDC002994]|uniref:ATP-grasp domain-containing protein n=1 Tax=Streptomyces sp. NPDC002994 TaxID=3154441 RepID=UPI0033B94882
MTGVRRRPHVVVIHRWRARYAHYERYLDHTAHAVSYITTEVGAEAVPEGAVEIAVVAATDDLAHVRKQLDALATRHGAPRSVVALKEDDLLVAAQLAMEWNCRARRPQELLPMRDKLLMARAVSGAGLAAPAFATAPDRRAVRAFAERHGWPVVLKPRTGSSSEGVVRIDDAAGLNQAFEASAAEELLVQAYNPHPVHHVDGVFDGRDLGPWRVSRYLNTCLGFRSGDSLGSVEVDRPEVRAAIGDFTRRVLRALTDRPTAFHLEVFVESREDSSVRCSFLEIGARVGGSEIPFLWREVHGYDLMEAAFRIALGQPPQPYEPPGPPAAGPEIGGWLLVPAPAARPCLIQEVTPMTGREPGPYAEALLRPGEILPAADAYYEHVGGRFRFRGATSAGVEAAVVATARDFRVRGIPCGSTP